MGDSFLANSFDKNRGSLNPSESETVVKFVKFVVISSDINEDVSPRRKSFIHNLFIGLITRTSPFLVCGFPLLLSVLFNETIVYVWLEGDFKKTEKHILKAL
jgi:hypothetical protein